MSFLIQKFFLSDEDGKWKMIWNKENLWVSFDWKGKIEWGKVSFKLDEEEKKLEEMEKFLEKLFCQIHEGEVLLQNLKTTYASLSCEFYKQVAKEIIKKT